jgi:ABC-type Fe2+-enterobactin transport system substrate-binding protein
LSETNGVHADDGTELAVPITAHYHLQAKLEVATGKLADAERTITRLERELAELRAAIATHAPDSPLAKREALRAQVSALGPPR